MDLSFIFPMTRLLPRNIYPIFRVISGTHPLENRWDTGPCHGAPGENKIVLGQPARKLGFRICLKWVKNKPSYGDMTGVSWKIEHDIDLDCWWRQKSMNIMSAFGTIGDLGGGLQRPSPNSCGLPSPHFPFILNSPIYDHFMPIFHEFFPLPSRCSVVRVFTATCWATISALLCSSATNIFLQSAKLKRQCR